MIPVLLSKNESNIDRLMKSMGIGALAECQSCKVTHIANDQYSLTLTYPMNGRRANDLDYEYYIRAKANNYDDDQLFRIKKITKDTINGNYIVYAEHIFFDLADNFVEGVSLHDSGVLLSGQAILDNCHDKHNFRFVDSDVKSTNDFTFALNNPIYGFRGSEGSLIDVYGNGMVIYPDNYDIYAYEDKDSGETIEYRKNIIGFTEDTDMDGMVTVIYPYANVQDDQGNDTMITLTEKYIYADSAEKFMNHKIRAIDLSGEDVTDEKSLRAEAEKYIKNAQTEPKITYNIDIASLSKTSEYKKLKRIEKYRVGYKVKVRDKRFGMNMSTKISKIVYNTLLETIETIILGNYSNNMAGLLKTDYKDRINKNLKTLQYKLQGQIDYLNGSGYKPVTGTYDCFMEQDQTDAVFIIEHNMNIIPVANLVYNAIDTQNYYNPNNLINVSRETTTTSDTGEEIVITETPSELWLSLPIDMEFLKMSCYTTSTTLVIKISRDPSKAREETFPIKYTMYAR